MSDIQEQITPLERAKEITSESKTEDKKNNGTEKPQYFYRLLLTQLAVIFISTFLHQNSDFIFAIKFPFLTPLYLLKSASSIQQLIIQEVISLLMNTVEHMKNADKVITTLVQCTFLQSLQFQSKTKIKQYNFAFFHYQNQFEVWKNAVVQENTVYTTLYYFSLILFPSLLILQSVFRNCQLIKQKQKLFYYLQFPSMSLFIQLCTHLIKQTENSNIFYHLRILLIYQIGIVTFFYMNQKCLKWQLEFKSTTQKLVNYSFILICLKEILNCISLNQSNWIPHILFILYTQVHLLHLNANLFNENTKYAIHNDSVLQLIKQKLQSLFDVQDVYKEVAKTYFVISNRMMYSLVVGIIVAMIFRDLIFNLQNYFTLSGIFLILIWDTSLVSTSSKLTLQDQYQAASLYFLDFMQPIRNIILALLA